MKNDRTLLIIGAAGVVGTHIASLSVERFSKIILVDIEPLKEKLDAIARDIRTQFNLFDSNTEVVATTNYDEIGKLNGRDVIVIPAGKARDPNDKNSTREALFSFNRRIVDGIGKILKEKVFLEKEQPFVIVLTNPVDSILKSLIISNNFDPKKTVGSGNQLDSVRFKQNLADKLNMKDEDIKYAFVLGQHGKNMAYSIDKIKVHGAFLSNFMKKHNISKDVIKEACDLTTNEGSRIIAASGATCFGPAASVIAIIDSYIGNKGKLFSLSTMHRDGNCFGYPVYINGDGVEFSDMFLTTSSEYGELKKSIECINELL